MGPTPPPHGTGGPPSKKSFDRPDSTIHILTGNGGPPSKDTMNSPMAALRNKSNTYGYGRLTAYNASHLRFEQVLNGYAWATRKRANQARCSTRSSSSSQTTGHSAARLQWRHDPILRFQTGLCPHRKATVFGL
eukprot:2605021-Prymnesium_polylepis.1